MQMASDFKIQAYSKKQLQELYGVSAKTFRSWLQSLTNLGAYRGKAFTPDQVTKIIQHLGTP